MVTKEIRQIPLDLSVHCIETELKRDYHQAIRAYFKSGEQKKERLEATISVLQHLLETVDFPRLRASHPVLAGGADVLAYLCIDEDALFIIADEARIYLDPETGKDIFTCQDSTRREYI